MKIYYSNNACHHQIYSSRHQQGFTLLEALIAFIILAGGLMAAFRFHNTTMETTAEAKVRAEAVVLAEQKMEELRSYLSLAEFSADVVTGNDLVNDTGGGAYAAAFTRGWTASANNPSEVSVTVSWDDHTGNNSEVQMTSLVWGSTPRTSASEFVRAVSFADGTTPVWPVPDPLNKGTKYGGGKVTISTLYDENNVDLVGDPLIGVSYFYDVNFVGTIESVGTFLLSVSLAGGPDVSALCTVSDPTLTNPVGATAVFYDIENDVWLDSGARDEFGALTGNVITDPYLYTCNIIEVPHGDTWTGTITYVGEELNDAVCVPNEGSTELTFSEQSPALLQLGVVVADNNGLCNQFN